MASLTADFVARALDTAVVGRPPQGAFGGVSTDSRSVAAGELFVALAGPSFDGHDYVDAALAAGAAGAVVRRDFVPAADPGACRFPVDDTLRALGELAGAWRREHSALVAAVTGSNGKTTTKEMLAAILGQRHREHKNQGNFNNLVGLPLTLLALEPSHTVCITEMGMNAAGEIARLTEIASPEVGVITNVGPAHLGSLGSLEAVAAAKTELFTGLSPAACAVVNLDDPWLAPWAERLDCRVLTFGFGPRADCRAYDISAVGTRQAFSLQMPQGPAVRVRLAVPGRHNVANALAAAAAAWALGQGSQAIVAGLESFKPVKGRLNLSWVPGGPLLVNDTYNANPASLAGGLQALKDIASGRRMALILGDMLELGPEAGRLHHQAGAAAVGGGCRVVLALGRFAGEVAAGARGAGLEAQSARAFDDLDQLVQAALGLLGEGDVVLVKGSRSMGMERAVARLEEMPWGED